jgi:hypothetical protein
MPLLAYEDTQASLSVKRVSGCHDPKSAQASVEDDDGSRTNVNRSTVSIYSMAKRLLWILVPDMIFDIW